MTFEGMKVLAATTCVLCGKAGDYDEMVRYGQDEQPAHPPCVELAGLRKNSVSPIDVSISQIQRINVERANRWRAGDFHQWSGLEWAGAMCGEAGEAANIAKKLRRCELELDGNRFSDRKPAGVEALIAELAHECADTFLYLTLLTARYDIDLDTAVRNRFNAKSEEMGFPERI